MKVINQHVITSPSRKPETGPLFCFLHEPSASSLKMLRVFFGGGWLRHKNGGDALSTNLEISKVLHVLTAHRRWKMEDGSRKFSGSWTHGVVVALEIRIETETAPPYITCMTFDTSAHFSVYASCIFMCCKALSKSLTIIPTIGDSWHLVIV